MNTNGYVFCVVGKKGFDSMRWYFGERPHLEQTDGLVDENDDVPWIQAQLKHSVETEEKHKK